MPYEGEVASKSSHADIIKNADVQAFLADCEYLKTPSDEEAETQCARFEVPPPAKSETLPAYVLAVDGSPYEASVTDRLPSTMLGFIKVGSVLIDMTQYASLRIEGSRLVDPFRVAKLQENSSPLTFSVPSANVKYKGIPSVRDGFRAAVDDQLHGRKTRFRPDDASTSLRSTLFHLAASRPIDKLGTDDPRVLKLHKCPTCGGGPVEVRDVPVPQFCPTCKREIYPSDCLRLWEAVSDHQSNGEAINRLMSYVEHLMPIHYMRYLADNSLSLLASTAFFVDGPLAVFGNGAWLSAAIMRYVTRLNTRLTASGHSPLVMIGLQKTGQVADYLSVIDRFVPVNRILPIDDDYRYRYIRAGSDKPGYGFGDETYYGQDFAYKTPSGRIFTFALPYPFESKRIPTEDDFIKAKVAVQRYKELPRALALIQHFECDLYENAVVPIALAHRYTSISLMPGGQVLDILTRRALNQAV